MVNLDVSLDIDDESLDRLGESGRRAIHRAIELMATEVWGNVAREAPVDTGRLAGSFQLSPMGQLAYRVSSDALYASYVHEGTGLFGPSNSMIVPNRAQVLVFEAGGSKVFARSTKGQKPNPYADRAIKKAGNRAAEFASRAVSEVMA